MTDKEKVDQIKAYIERNYKPEAGAKSSIWSHGNSDDVFSDGVDWGGCHVLWEISKMAGLDLPEPHDQEYD